MGWTILLPIIIPFCTAIVGFFLQKKIKTTFAISVLGSFLALISNIFLIYQIHSQGTLAVSLGNWPAPFGIVFAVDRLGSSLSFITALIGLAITIYSYADLRSKTSFSLYLVLMQFLLGGVTGAFLTGDLFNLYVWFEVMLISSFALLIVDAQPKQLDGAIKYVALNLISTMALLLGIGLLYGWTGALNLADLHLKSIEIPIETAKWLSILFIFAFAIKSGLFPVFAWLPATYPTAPTSIVALFAALLTKVGVYAFIRLFTLVFPLDRLHLQNMFIVLAGLTMLVGVLGAAYQYSIKRILSFHIISQIGYMMMGLALFTVTGLIGTVFYLIHHIIVKANLFLIGGILQHRFGSDDLKKLGGAYTNTAALAFIFLIPALSLAGVPPLSGFWGKLLVIQSSLQVEQYILATTALFVGLLTLFSMMKIWNEAFWKPQKQPYVLKINKIDLFCLYSPVIVLALLTMVIGFGAETFYQWAQSSAQELLDPSAYVKAVLGSTE